jgi:voltage-gated potassium channel
MEKIRYFLIALHKERFFKIFGVMSFVLFISSIGIYYFESGNTEGDVKTIFDSLWWSIVTITTVGYGDTVPRTISGRIIAMITMITGLFFLSIITATIASVFVGRKMKEEKGLETIKTKGHILICGWNEWADEIIEAINYELPSKKIKIVLINELPIEEVDRIRQKYLIYDIEYVRGDFVFENVLKRANIQHAEAIIVLADTSGGRSPDRADERTIMTTLAIKGLSPKIRTCAELLNPNNRQHLLRARVDEVIIRGEKTGALIASAAISPGLPKVILSLLSHNGENRLWKASIPSRFIGKPISELTDYFRKTSNALLIGILTEEKGIRIEDILSHDMTSIDEFIKRKFEESHKDYFHKEMGYRINLNPDPEYIIGKMDFAVVISKKRP